MLCILLCKTEYSEQFPLGITFEFGYCSTVYICMCEVPN